MSIEILVAKVKPLRDGLWETEELAPREVRSLGPCASSVGAVTVLLVGDSSFDKSAGALRFAPDAATVLNVGNSNRAVIVASGTYSAPDTGSPAATARAEIAAGHLGTGDRQFLRTLGELPDEVRKAGETILQRVRQHFPGDLRPVSARRFQETPDNFWFVTVQPRDQSLSITVRGLPDRFPMLRLQVIEDRRPYSRFKVKGLTDVPEAVEVILHAVRKGA